MTLKVNTAQQLTLSGDYRLCFPDLAALEIATLVFDGDKGLDLKVTFFKGVEEVSAMEAFEVTDEEQCAPAVRALLKEFVVGTTVTLDKDGFFLYAVKEAIKKSKPVSKVTPAMKGCLNS